VTNGFAAVEWSCYTAAAKTLLSCLTAPARLLRGTLLWRGPIPHDDWQSCASSRLSASPRLDYALRQMKPVCEIKSPGARKGICRGSMPSRLEVRAAGLLFLTAMSESNGNVARQRPRAPQFAGDVAFKPRSKPRICPPGTPLGLVEAIGHSAPGEGCCRGGRRCAPPENPAVAADPV
jgi:hypothetical protein